MQAGADDATIVVSAPASITGALKAPTATQPAPVAPATAGGPAPDTQASRSRTQEDLALAHLAARQATRSKPSVAAQDTPAAADETVAVPRPAQASALPPPLPVVAAVPPADDGPMPVPLPAVPSSGAALVSGAGRSTVDAPVIAAPPERPAPAVPAAAAGHGEVSPRVASSSPRLAAPAAPPPVAARGAVQAPPAHATSPTPSARRGVSAAVIVAGMVALLALCFVVAFVAVRSFGLLSGPSLSGLFTRTVEPKVTGPAAVSTTTPPPTAPTATEVPVTVDEANDPQAGVAEPPAAVPAPVAPPVPTDVTPSPSPPPTATVAPRATRTPPVRDTPRESRTAQVPPETTRPVAPPVRETPREVAPPAAENPPPPRPVERREPDPPPVLAPTDDGLALVRAYVAARNTAHASGIRRVWPDVDDNHLRRITSAFSAPLTLAGCDIAAQDAAHATATCRLTQPGTTGAYASAQGLTIRRTFVFDLARQGRVWVIVGLRE